MLSFNVPFVWRIISNSVATLKSVMNVGIHSHRKIELDRLAYLSNTNQIIDEPPVEIEQNERDLTRNITQSLLFGYAAYRVLNGQEDFSDWLIAGAATAYSLYDPAKKIANQIIESETVQTLGNKVFVKR